MKCLAFLLLASCMPDVEQYPVQPGSPLTPFSATVGPDAGVVDAPDGGSVFDDAGTTPEGGPFRDAAAVPLDAFGF